MPEIELETRLREDLRERFDDVFEAADMAFWAVVANAYPEASAGDFAWDATFEWQEAAKKAIARWVLGNVPDAEPSGCERCGTEDVGRFSSDGPLCDDCAEDQS